MKKESINTFNGGMECDTFPLAVSNQVLTDALNATILTNNGDSFVLQNDMGNITSEGWNLPEGFIPVGMKEHGGIIYIVSFNPDTKKGQVGSFPSPSTLNPKRYESIVGEGDELESTISNSNLGSLFYPNNTDTNRSFIKDVSLDQYLMSGDTYNVSFTAPYHYISRPGARYLLTVKLCSLGKNNKLSDLEANIQLDKSDSTSETFVAQGVYKHKTSGKLVWLFELETLDDFIVDVSMDKDNSGWTISWEYDNTPNLNYLTINGTVNNSTLTFNNKVSTQTGTTNQVIYYRIVPSLAEIELNEWSIEGTIDTEKIGTGDLTFNKWKYLIKDNKLLLNWGASHYPKSDSEWNVSLKLHNLLENNSFYVSLGRSSKSNWTGEYVDKLNIGQSFDIKKDTCYIAEFIFTPSNSNVDETKVIYKLLSTFDLYDYSMYYDDNNYSDYDDIAQKITVNLVSDTAITLTNTEEIVKFETGSEIINDNEDESSIEIEHSDSTITRKYNINPTLKLVSSNSSILVYNTANNSSTVTATVSLGNVELTDLSTINIGGTPTITNNDETELLTLTIDNNTDSSFSNVNNNSNHKQAYNGAVYSKLADNILEVKQTSYMSADSKNSNISGNGYEFTPYIDANDPTRMAQIFGFNPYDSSDWFQIKESWGIWHNTNNRSNNGNIDDGTKTYNRSVYRLFNWVYTTSGSSHKLTLEPNGIDTPTITGANSKFDYNRDFKNVIEKYNNSIGNIPKVLFNSCYNSSDDSDILEGLGIPNYTDYSNGRHICLTPAQSRLNTESFIKNGIGTKQNKYFNSNWVVPMWKTSSVDKTSYVYLPFICKINENNKWTVDSGTTNYDSDINYTDSSYGVGKILENIFGNIYVGQPSFYSYYVRHPKSIRYNESYKVISKVNFAGSINKSNIQFKYGSGELLTQLQSGVDNASITSSEKTTLKNHLSTMFTFNIMNLSNNIVSLNETKEVISDSANINEAAAYFYNSSSSDVFTKFAKINDVLISTDINGNPLDTKYSYQLVSTGTDSYGLELLELGKSTLQVSSMPWRYDFVVKENSETGYNELLYSGTNSGTKLYIGIIVNTNTSDYIMIDIAGDVTKNYIIS